MRETFSSTADQYVMMVGMTLMLKWFAGFLCCPNSNTDVLQSFPSFMDIRRMLGYTSGNSTMYSRFGSVPTNFSMDDVNCVGTEASLLDCTHITNHNCGSHEGAGVICSSNSG